MTKRMLINATQAEELRVALVDGQWLYDLDIENAAKEQKKSNIYKAKITRIEPSLEAAFVDYGAERHGFLPFREIAAEYFQDGNRETPIKDRIRIGQELIIQVDKEERGNKGAALTTYVSLAGCYLVLMPNNPRAGGISRRIEGDDRAELREALNALTIPDGMGCIIRTAGVGRNSADLQWDLDLLVTQWHAIQDAAAGKPACFLIYQESNLVIRAIRDHLRPDIDEILIDSPKVFDNACEHIKMMRPDFIERVKPYNDAIPLFSRFQIESQIESAFRREVRLPSGGAIVIDHTEALISIDINSAKATKGGDIEETAHQTNLEAADEIARQLRLRDVGGLIVIDFIDMGVNKHQRNVEQRLRDALAMDRARVQVGRISRFGLLEMSRQRLRPALSESREIPCPQCNGQGTVRSIEALSLDVLRLIEEEAIKDNTLQINAELPVASATYLINEKREAVLNLERRQRIKIVIIPNPSLLQPNFNVSRIRKEDTGATGVSSYKMATQPATETEYMVNRQNTQQTTLEQPAVKPITAATPQPTNPRSVGLIKRIWSSIVGDSGLPSSSNDDTGPQQHNKRHHKSGGHPNRRNHNRRGNNNNRNRNNSKPRRSNNPRDKAPHTANPDTAGNREPNGNQAANTDSNNQRKRNFKPRNGQSRRRRRNPNQRGGGNEKSDSKTHATDIAVD